MRALVWTGPKTFELQKIPDPTPHSDEVILKVKYAGICGSDLSGYLGENSLRKPPLIMGHEFTGEVYKLGDEVDGLSVGDLVVVNPLISCGKCRMCQNGNPQNCAHWHIIGIHVPGAYADFVKVPSHLCYKTIHPLGSTLVEPLACAVRATRHAEIQLGDDVVIFGAGMIGLFSMQLARMRGASKCVLVDPNESRLALGSLFGSTHSIVPSKEDVNSYVRNILGGEPNRIIDAVGLPKTRQQSVELVQNGGNVVFIGLHEDDTLLPGNLVVRKEVQINGSFTYSNEDFYEALKLVEDGLIKSDERWLDVRPLEEGKDAFDEQITGEARYPKLVLSL